MTYEIYLITNLINNKKYIGQTKSTIGYQNRFKQHCDIARNGKRKALIHKAIDKYGAENFKIELIAENIPEDRIDYWECYWINKFNTFSPNGCGYNMTIGGQGVHGYLHTKEDLIKISESGKKYWVNLKENNPEEYFRLCKVRSDNLKGIPKSKSARENSSRSAKKRFENEPGTFTGKKHSDYSKNLVSIANGQKVGMFDIDSGELVKEF